MYQKYILTLERFFFEREDEAHVLKVYAYMYMYMCTTAVFTLSVSLQKIGHHTRSGSPEKLYLLHFKAAYDDPSTGLTLAALTGTRKQSVTDAERLFSPGVAEFTKKGYSYEYKYIKAISNWRRACDERGLSELERCRFNYGLLKLILDELISWHKDTYDLGPLEVNRYHI